MVMVENRSVFLRLSVITSRLSRFLAIFGGRGRTEWLLLSILPCITPSTTYYPCSSFSAIIMIHGKEEENGKIIFARICGRHPYFYINSMTARNAFRFYTRVFSRISYALSNHWSGRNGPLIFLSET